MKKLAFRLHISDIMSLSKQHVINSLLDKHHSKKIKPHHMVYVSVYSQVIIENQEFYSRHQQLLE